MPPTLPPAIGETFECVYPFVRDTFGEWMDDSDGGRYQDGIPTWKPGTRNEAVGHEGDSESVADAMGRMVLTVVSVHKPGKYPTRVFFTRAWVTPDGKSFGKTKCRMSTVGAFRSLLGGYRHRFVMTGCECDGCQSWDDHRVGNSRAASEVA